MHMHIKISFSNVSTIRIFILKKHLSALSSVRVFWGLGQAAQARVSSPPGASCPKAASPPGGGQAAQGGGKIIPWYLHPREASFPEAASAPGVKLPRVQDKLVHQRSG